jgi:hypothetical protein
MKIVLTICSLEKDNSMEDLPAKIRYTNPRIKEVNEIAINENLPFYILSGKFGLLKSTSLIPWYDKLLEHEDVKSMVPLLVEQLVKEKISKIHFYGKSKSASGWGAYYDLLELACEKLMIKLTVFEI